MRRRSRSSLRSTVASAAAHGDIQEHHHHAFDPIVHGAIWTDAHLVPAAVGGLNLAIDRLQRLEHPSHVIFHLFIRTLLVMSDSGRPMSDWRRLKMSRTRGVASFTCSSDRERSWQSRSS